MKKFLYRAMLLGYAVCWLACADNTLEEQPQDDDFPFQLVLDTDEGADLPDAEDYDLEIKFADYLPGLDLPDTPITLQYAITDLEDDMVGLVVIDKIVYEVEIDECVYERELAFTATGDGTTGAITIAPDTDLGSVPESFEVVFTLPGVDDASGSFKFEISNLQGGTDLVLGYPRVFEYEVLDNDLAGEWVLTLADEAAFDAFRSVFGAVSDDLDNLSFADITGEVKVEFEFEEMKFVIELQETEEVTECEDGETETSVGHKEIEIEADYDADDGELELEGSYFIFGDDGEIEQEPDYIMEAAYTMDGDAVTITFFKVFDEDHYEDDEALFNSEDGMSFVFYKD